MLIVIIMLSEDGATGSSEDVNRDNYVIWVYGSYISRKRIIAATIARVASVKMFMMITMFYKDGATGFSEDLQPAYREGNALSPLHSQHRFLLYKFKFLSVLLLLLSLVIFNSIVALIIIIFIFIHGN